MCVLSVYESGENGPADGNGILVNTAMFRFVFWSKTIFKCSGDVLGDDGQRRVRDECV